MSKPSESTEYHIALVNTYVKLFVSMLVFQGESHDASKLQSPEKELFDAHSHKLSGMKFGSKEYKQCLKDLDVALKHHYKHNRHHPQHFKHGINDMNLVDIIIMFCDWRASCARMSGGGDMSKSIKYSAKRFRMSKQLEKIFQNTKTIVGA